MLGRALAHCHGRRRAPRRSGQCGVRARSPDEGLGRAVGRIDHTEFSLEAGEGEHAVLLEGHGELLRGEAVDLVTAVGDEVEYEAQLAEFLGKASHFLVAHAGGVPIERRREVVGEHLVWKLRVNCLGELARVIEVSGLCLHPEQVGERRRRKSSTLVSTGSPSLDRNSITSATASPKVFSAAPSSQASRKRAVIRSNIASIEVSFPSRNDATASEACPKMPRRSSHSWSPYH